VGKRRGRAGAGEGRWGQDWGRDKDEDGDEGVDQFLRTDLRRAKALIICT